MALNLRQLFRIAQRRWWIVLLPMVLVGTSAYWSASRVTPQYSTTATILVNSGSSASSSVDYNAILTTQSLAATYQELVTAPAMRERVNAAMGNEEAGDNYSASIQEGSQIISIAATGTDAESVALLANTVVTEFQNYIEEMSDNRTDMVRSGIDAQATDLETRQAEIDEELAVLDVPENADNPSIQRQIEDLMTERSNNREALLDLKQQAITVSTQIDASTVLIQPLGEARVPTEPFEPQPQSSLVLGLLIGAVIGSAVVALQEYLDNTVKPETNIQALTRAPLLATISSVSGIASGWRQVFTMTQPRSSAAESMRLLRTNVEFASATSPIHSVTVSSSSPGEGKSTVAANLGVVMAQAGLITVLIDADLRRPTQHRIFEKENRWGLTTLLTHPELEWKGVAQKTEPRGLHLITSGPIPPNPSDLLASDTFERLVNRIKADVDLVIIDSPPVLSASDALAIANHTDGVILVTHSGRTRTDTVRQTTRSIHLGGIRLIGLVLNRQKGPHPEAYNGEYYPEVSDPALMTLPSSDWSAGTPRPRTESVVTTPVRYTNGHRDPSILAPEGD